MRLFDAHNHLQDERLKPRETEIITTAQQKGVTKMVVNGSCEEDWDQVLDLGRRYPALVIPSFGLHPWYVSERTESWQTKLEQMLNAIPSAIGEIGLDKWILEDRSSGSPSPPMEERVGDRRPYRPDLSDLSFEFRVRVWS